MLNIRDLQASLATPKPWPKYRKGAAAIAVAVAATLPAIGVPRTARADNNMQEAMVLLAEQAKPTDPELLAKGIEQYNQAKYEDAQITLQQVKVDGLAQPDKQTLGETLRKVESAIGQRQAAAAAFEKGEEALTAKNYDEAIKNYRAAMENKFANEATRSKAASQLAVAQAAVKNGGGKFDKNAYFKEAIADKKAGRLEIAREKFVKLDQMGFKGGLLDTRPAEYIREIDTALAARATVAPKVAAGEPVPPGISPRTPTTMPANPTAVAGRSPTTVPVASNGAGKQSYDAGVAAYRRGDYRAARSSFLEAEAAGYVPAAQFDTPARYIAMIDRREAAAEKAAGLGPAVVARTTQPTVPAPDLSPAERELRATAGIEAAREQIKQYEVQVLLDKARKAQEDNRLSEAYQSYKQAHDLDPANREANQGMARLQAMIVGVNPQTILGEQLKLMEAIRTADTYYFNQAIQDAKAALAADQFTLVKEALDRAQAARDAHRDYFSREALASFDGQIRQVQDAARDRQEEARIAQVKAIQQKEIEKQQAEQQQIAKERREQIAKLTADAKRYIHDRNYVAALKVVNHLLVIDPSNDFGNGVKRLVQDYSIIQEERNQRELHDREFERQLDRAEENKIPYMDILRYPDNWPEISDKRDRAVAAERRQGGGEGLGPQAALDRNFPELNFKKQGLAEVIDWFRDNTKANIFVSWSALEAAGVKPDAPVEVQFHQPAKFAAVLKRVLNEVGGPKVKLGYTVEDGIITITTADEIAKNAFTQLYDIRDLLVTIPEPDPLPPSTMAQRLKALRAERAQAKYTPWGAGAPSDPYYSSSPSAPRNGESAIETIPAGSLTPSQRAEQQAAVIIDTIRRMVDRDSWIDNGGKIGDIKYIQGQLAVNQTPDNQRQVVGLLDRLRELHAIQVSIETRFLTVQRNYMEDIGVDLDFIFNITNPQHWSPIPVSQTSSDFTQNPSTSAPGTIGGITGAKPAMTIQGSFLDDYQVNFLIRASQANRHSTIMTAPRVTVWNGQVATLVVGTQQSYVADLDAISSAGALYGSVAYLPVLSTILSGATLTVRPTVSADRKYVTLSLTPTLSQLIDLVPFAVAAVNAGGTAGTGGTGVGANPNATVGVGNIQLPLTQITTLQTIVTVPDEGTLMLGGQTIAGEIENEEGVPILSKIPFLKRLFTNRSTAKDEQVLLILVRPKILIQREMEQDAFPTLNTRGR